jgi:hypothetical protein
VAVREAHDSLLARLILIFKIVPLRHFQDQRRIISLQCPSTLIQAKIHRIATTQHHLRRKSIESKQLIIELLFSSTLATQIPISAFSNSKLHQYCICVLPKPWTYSASFSCVHHCLRYDFTTTTTSRFLPENFWCQTFQLIEKGLH